MQTFIKGLNKNQELAATSDSSRILCLAGAGTGKTRTLTARIANLHHNRIGVESMLALTFTRMAGHEMKRRIIDLIGEEDGKKLFCNTFHSFAVRLLKLYGWKIGINDGFTIYDDQDREAIFNRIAETADFKITVGKALRLYTGELDSDDTAVSYEEKRSYYAIKTEYESRMLSNNALDLSNLIDIANALIRNRPEIAYELRDQYKYVFIDEYQDTSTAQSDFIEMLDPENLFIVGDDYQSIYEWRDARPENIIKIANESPENGFEIIRLEWNYRSTQWIIDIANEIISANKRRTEKKLIPFITGSGIDNSIIEFQTMREELQNISQEIKTDLCKDTAILCRTNAQVDTISEYLSDQGIEAMTISKRNDVLKRPHIRLLIRALQLAINPEDDHSLLCTINAWDQYASTSLLRDASLKSAEQEVPIMRILRNDMRARQFVSIIDEIRDEDCAADSMNALIEKLDLRLKNDMIGLDNRNEDLSKLLEIMNRWEGRQLGIGESVSIEAFMIWVMLRDIQSAIEENVETPVKIMTIHSAKGLEFNRVFIPQVNNNVFPSVRGDLEEERRLFFVAVTRAEDELHISCSKERIAFYNKVLQQEPSILFLAAESSCRKKKTGV